MFDFIIKLLQKLVGELPKNQLWWYDVDKQLVQLSSYLHARKDCMLANRMRASAPARLC